MALTDSLVAYWTLDEASGSRADAVGSNTLTDNNTVTQNTGKVSDAAQFTLANSEWLSCVDNADLSLGTDTDFTVALWVYLDTKAAAATILAKRSTATTSIEYRVAYDLSNDRFRINISNGTTTTSLNASSIGSPATATWYFIVFWHNKTADTINISVNDGTVDSAAHSAGTQNTAHTFVLGVRDAGGANEHLNGRIDESGLWKRVLTGAERTTLYNSGNGLTYPFTSGTIYTEVGNVVSIAQLNGIEVFNSLDTGLMRAVFGNSGLDARIAVDIGNAVSIASVLDTTLWSMVDACLAQSALLALSTHIFTAFETSKAIAVFSLLGVDTISSLIPVLTMPTKIVIVNSGETQVTINDSE